MINPWDLEQMPSPNRRSLADMMQGSPWDNAEVPMYKKPIRMKYPTFEEQYLAPPKEEGIPVAARPYSDFNNQLPLTNPWDL